MVFIRALARSATTVVTDVVGHAGIGDGVPWGKALLGRHLDITPSGPTFGDCHCSRLAAFESKPVETVPYLEQQEAGARSEDAKLPARVFILDSPNCNPVFWIDRYTIEFDDTGVFVRARRVD